MKYSCGLIRDVMPLYHDGVCSGDSQEAIMEHLKQCEECRTYLAAMEDRDKLSIEEKQEAQSQVNVIKKIKTKIFRKKVIVSMVSILCSVLIMIGISIFANNYTVPIELHNENIEVKMEDGHLYAYTNEHVYRLRTQIVSNKSMGKEHNDLYFTMSSTIWNKYFYKNSGEPGKQLLTLETPAESMKENKNGIDHVYYYVGDLSKLEEMNEEKLAAATEKADLVWSKE